MTDHDPDLDPDVPDAAPRPNSRELVVEVPQPADAPLATPLRHTTERPSVEPVASEILVTRLDVHAALRPIQLVAEEVRALTLATTPRHRTERPQVVPVAGEIPVTNPDLQNAARRTNSRELAPDVPQPAVLTLTTPLRHTTERPPLRASEILVLDKLRSTLAVEDTDPGCIADNEQPNAATQCSVKTLRDRQNMYRVEYHQHGNYAPIDMHGAPRCQSEPLAPTRPSAQAHQRDGWCLERRRIGRANPSPRH